MRWSFPGAGHRCSQHEDQTRASKSQEQSTGLALTGCHVEMAPGKMGSFMFAMEMAMSPATEKLLSSALALPEAERLELAEALFAASQPPIPEPTGEAWLAELNRRSAEVASGEAVLTPWPEVKERVHKR